MDDNKSDEGYIYILSNEMYGFYGEDVYKIGKTNDIAKRLNAFTTCCVKSVDLKFLSERCVNYHIAERLIFMALRDYGVVENREFFKHNLLGIINIIEEIVSCLNNRAEEHDDIVKKLQGIRYRKITAHAPSPRIKLDTLISKGAFDEYLTATTDNRLSAYLDIHKRVLFLSLEPVDSLTLMKFRDVIIDPSEMRRQNIMSLLQYDVSKEITESNTSLPTVEIQDKVSLIKELEHELLKIIKTKSTIYISEQAFDQINMRFRTSKDKPLTYRGIMNLIVSVMRHACGRDIITYEALNTRVHRDKISNCLNKKVLDFHL